MARRRSSGYGLFLAIASAASAAAILFRSRSAEAKPMKNSEPDLSGWRKAKLTEYYPDLPSTASAKEKRREGGATSRSKYLPVITLDQHRSDREKYPFATVAADVNLEGKVIKIGYGPRVYFAEYPDDIFRIYDTGGNFTGSDKKMENGIEPFDIAVSYSGLRGKIGGMVTLYRVDWEDVLSFPQRLRLVLTS